MVGETVQLGYVDQSRDHLDGSKTVWEEVSDGLDVMFEAVRLMREFLDRDPEFYRLVVAEVCLDGGTQLPGPGHLDERGALRHHDERPHADDSGSVGHPLSVVAGRGGDHSTRPLVVGERQDPVEGATGFERPGALEGLVLEKEPGATALGERLGFEAGGVHHPRGNAG